MSDPNEQFLIQQDHKERQRNENYHRAEAFLVWKLGMVGFREVNDLVRRGSRGEDTLNSLFVEFVERVEKDLMERTRIIEELHFKWLSLEAATNPYPRFIQEAAKETTNGG